MIEVLSKGLNAWILNKPSPMLMGPRCLHSSSAGITLVMNSSQSPGPRKLLCEPQTTKWTMEVCTWVLEHARQQWDHYNEELHKQTNCHCYFLFFFGSSIFHYLYGLQSFFVVSSRGSWLVSVTIATTGM